MSVVNRRYLQFVSLCMFLVVTIPLFSAPAFAMSNRAEAMPYGYKTAPMQVAFQLPANTDSTVDFVVPELPLAQVNPEPQVTATITVAQQSVSPGGTVMANVTVMNDGDVPLPDYAINLLLSDGLTINADDTISGNLPSLAPGTKQEWSLPITVNETAVSNQYISLYGTAQNAPVIDEYIELSLNNGTPQMASLLATTSSSWGDEPEAWAPRIVTPEVSLFSGAATYNYPFDVVPGRAGLQPTLALNYNHHNSEAIAIAASSGDYHEGWSMSGIPYITREGIKACSTSNLAHKARIQNEFVLSLNGRSYPLVKVDTSTNYGRYGAKGGPELFVGRYNDTGNGNGYPGSSENATGEYWIVRTPDGTEYRFGYDANSEQLTARIGGPDEKCLNDVDTVYTGRLSRIAVVRWWIDQVADAHGNFMEYTYNDSPNYENNTCKTFETETGNVTYCRETMEYLQKIEYNNGTAGVAGGYKSAVEFTWGGGSPRIIGDSLIITSGKNRIESLTIKHSGQTVWTYHFNSEQVKQYGNNHTISKLTSIVKTFPGESLSSPTIPATTFEYTVEGEMPSGHNKVCDWPNSSKSENYYHPFLRRVHNGYGGTYEFTYSTSKFEIIDGDGDCSDGAFYDLGKAYSYFVTDLKVWDGVQNVYGVHTTPTTWQAYEFDPSDACFGHDANTNKFKFDGAEYDNPCMGDSTESSKKLNGFYVGTVDVREGDGTVLSRTTTEFYKQGNGSLLLGQPKFTYQYDPADPNGEPLVTTTWHRHYATSNDSHCPSTGLTAPWACLESEVTKLKNSFNITDTTSPDYYDPGTEIWKEYMYLPGYSEHSDYQWGRATRIATYGKAPFEENWTALRIEFTAYVSNPDVSQWMNIPWASGTYNPSWQLENLSLNLYGNNTDPDGQVPQRGDNLTWTRQVLTQSNANGSVTYPTVDTYYQYGNFGLLEHTTTYDQYGLITGLFWPNGQPGSYSVGVLANDMGGPSATSTIHYASDGLTVDWMENAIGSSQRTTLGYTDSRFPWMLTEVTGSNGLRMRYEYDLAGRLLHIKRGNPSTSDADVTMTSYTYNIIDPPNANINTMLQIDEIVAPSDNNIKITNRSFYDGLGRVVQTRKFDVNIDGAAGNVIVQDAFYDALGRTICQSVPIPASNKTFYPHTCAQFDHTTTTYDTLGRTTGSVAPDGSRTAVLNGLNSTYTQDANNHVQAAYTDAWGRLTEVDETLSTFADDFQNSSSLNDWFDKNSIVYNGVVESTGNGTWTSNLRRAITADTDTGVSFSFNSANANIETILMLYHGNWNNSNYRRWSLVINHYGVQGIGFQEYEGASITKTVSLMPFKANTWYRAMIRGGQESGDYVLLVWEKDNPTNHAEYRMSKVDSEWQQSNWNFLVQAYTNNAVLKFDDYAELDFNRTAYTYDELDNLTRVTDVHGNLTTIGYDALGRKTSMSDPDMGAWSYEYNPAGDLVEQTDAKNQTICFTYDILNRIETKEIGTHPCPGTNVLASYTYDSAVNGAGKPATVSWAPNLGQNFDTFTYDGLGRVKTQERTIDGRTPYVMETLAFDALDRPTSVRYPNNEVITINYDTEGENSLLVDGTPLVNDVRYNVFGQMTYLDRNHATNIDTTYTYDTAGKTFRLTNLQHGTTNDNRPDFTYTYDTIGNITSVSTATNNYGTDTQTFTYDSLNRLVTAEALGGPASYAHTYTYDDIGNIKSFNGATYGYGDPNHVHALTSTSGGGSFSYDKNGNMITRADTTGNFSQVFDVENRLVQVVNATTGTQTSFFYDASGQRTKTVEPGSVTYYPFPNYEEEVLIPTETASVLGETGQITNLTHTPQTITLSNTYQNPVVFAQPISNNEAETATVRITSITNNSFTLYIDEAADSTDSGTHAAETVSYLVLEAGSWQLPGGAWLEVGTVDTAMTQGRAVTGWESVNYNVAFATTPVVLSQVQTNNDAYFVKTRHDNVSTIGFDVALEQDDVKSTAHGSETVGWMAISPGVGSWNGQPYEAHNTPDSVTSSWYTLSFAQVFTNAPFFVASIATHDGSDGANLRYTSLTANSVNIMAQEDTTLDSETSHTSEVVAYFAIAGSGNLTGYPLPGSVLSPAALLVVAERSNFNSVAERLSQSALFTEQLPTLILKGMTAAGVFFVLRMYPVGSVVRQAVRSQAVRTRKRQTVLRRRLLIGLVGVGVSAAVLVQMVAATDAPQTPALIGPQAVSQQSSGSSDVIYISTSWQESVGGVTFSEDDVVAYDVATDSWSMYFDGSDVGIPSGADIDAFTILDDGRMLISLDWDNQTVSGLTGVDSSDILVFTPTSVGETTAGSFDWYFDGSDVGLTYNNEHIVGATVLDDGRILATFQGSNVDTGDVSGVQDVDILAFTPTTLGADTSGTWEMYFDGSDVGLTELGDEDIVALWADSSGNPYLSTMGNFSVPGLSGASSDIFKCTASSLGDNTSCTYSMYFDGSAYGLTARVNAMYISTNSNSTPTATATAAPATNTPTPTSTAVMTATATATSTPASTGYSEDFAGYSAGQDPTGWVDTMAENSMTVDDTLFKTSSVGGSMAFGTTSTLANIHSHYTGGGTVTSDYRYTGRMYLTDSSGGVGVTFYSDYTNSDTYYRLRQYGTGSGASFHLASHGTNVAVEGTQDTGVTPTINTWYRFIVEVENVGSNTAIRAKVWEDGTTEPTTWQIDATDSSSPLTSGTFGLWAYSSGSKYWDDLAVTSLNATPTATPTATSTSVMTATATATNTQLPTNTPTNTPAASATATPTTSGSSGRVTTGLQVLYTFQEGSGSAVTDVSGSGTSLDLTIADSGNVSWLTGGGLSINTSTVISGTAPTDLINAVKTSDAISVEAWVKPANVTQEGPARIVSISGDPSNRDVTLGQGLWGGTTPNLYNVRLRTDDASISDNGQPALDGSVGSATVNLTHVVYTRDSSGNATLYINGQVDTTGTVPGTLANWDATFPLMIGNEVTGDRPWLGELYLVALYDKALTGAEVSQNYAAGAIQAAPTPTPTNTPTATPVPSGPAVIQRSTYSIGGQSIGLRVVEKDFNGATLSNELYYYHTDHLGSTSVMTKDSDGYIVVDSIARYTPFGDWRTEPSADLTDRGYTGHKHNNTGSNDIGLIYMNARYYVPNTNRFLTPDTIVSDPANPQTYNRFSYVLNSPLKHTDPSGHCAEGYMGDDYEDFDCLMLAQDASDETGVSFTALAALDWESEEDVEMYINAYNDWVEFKKWEASERERLDDAVMFNAEYYRKSNEEIAKLQELMGDTFEKAGERIGYEIAQFLYDDNASEEDLGIYMTDGAALGWWIGDESGGFARKRGMLGNRIVFTVGRFSEQSVINYDFTVLNVEASKEYSAVVHEIGFTNPDDNIAKVSLSTAVIPLPEW